VTRAGMPPEEDTYGFEIKWDIAAVPGGLAADPAAGLTESRAGRMLVTFDDGRPTPPPRMHARAGRSAADNARSPSPLFTVSGHPAGVDRTVNGGFGRHMNPDG